MMKQMEIEITKLTVLTKLMATVMMEMLIMMATITIAMAMAIEICLVMVTTMKEIQMAI